MIRYLKPRFLLITFLMQFTWSFSHGQNINNITIRENFVNFCKVVPREEIYVHTDREEYIAGEDIWFNIFLIDRQSNKAAESSDLVYFELLNPDNMPIIRKRIRIDKGSGAGQIILPDSISSGKYTIRAYTNWMKNFLPYNCFIQKVNIYNALSTKNFIEKPNTGNLNSETPLKNQEVSISVNNSATEYLEILVSTTSEFRTANGNICYLFIQTRGNLDYDNALTLRGKDTQIDLLKKFLKPGINQIVVIDSKGNPVAEKYIYTPANTESNLSLNISEISKTRTNIGVGLVTEIPPGSSDNPARLSVAVTPEAEYKYVQDITDYMVFGSEFGVLPDELRNKSLYDIQPQLIDNFLSTVKSNWIDWEQIANGTLPVPKYHMEKGQHYIYGKLVDKSSQIPQPGEYLFLSSPAKIASFQYALTDSTGSFYFKIPISGIAKDFIIQPEVVDKNYSVKIESSFSEEFLNIAIKSDSTVKPFPSYIPKWSVNYQVSKIFEVSYLGEPILPPVIKKEPFRFYGNPDIGLILDDYIKLPVMQEVFFELMPGVFLKNKKTVYEISLLDPVDKRVYSTPPLLLVDGVIIHDAAIIAALDPEIVERIDAVKEKYFIGDYMFFGLVNVITRAGNFSSVTLPDYAIRMQYKVIEPVNAYMSPDYSKINTTDDKLPDFRNTLYWNPSVVTDKNGKAEFGFWTSDIKSKYIINIQGISADGKPVSLKKHIIVN